VPQAARSQPEAGLRESLYLSMLPRLCSPYRYLRVSGLKSMNL